MRKIEMTAEARLNVWFLLKRQAGVDLDLIRTYCDIIGKVKFSDEERAEIGWKEQTVSAGVTNYEWDIALVRKIAPMEIEMENEEAKSLKALLLKWKGDQQRGLVGFTPDDYDQWLRGLLHEFDAARTPSA